MTTFLGTNAPVVCVFVLTNMRTKLTGVQRPAQPQGGGAEGETQRVNESRCAAYST